MSETSWSTLASKLIGCMGLIAFVALLLLAVGQPIFTDDAWIHLALGRVYSSAGPWLHADPLLANALGPPAPAAWLFDVALFQIERMTGFDGLRVLHVGTVIGILALAWSLIRRAGGSIPLACLGAGAFISMSAYRLVQLRPHLFTILATFLIYRLLVEGGSSPSRRRIAGSTALLAVWANVHAAFLLGPILIGAALAGVLVSLAFENASDSAAAKGRAAHLGAALGLGLLATLLNPSGIGVHLAWFVSGSDTPTLIRVADEWTPVDPFSLPVAGLPPSLLGFALFWLLMVATVGIAIRVVHDGRSGRGSTRTQVDPALLSMAIVALIAPMIAVRFLWLCIVPLLLAASWLGPRVEARGRLAAVASLAAAAMVWIVLVAFTRIGDWPMISRLVPRTLAGYAEPYRVAKYEGHVVWMLEDAGLEGTIFADYHLGGFLGYWLAPRIRTLVNGTLNVPAVVIDSNRPLRERRGRVPGQTFLELLDEQGLDLYLGIRLPKIVTRARPTFYSTAHLERAEGWIPIFRNLSGALYLRANERNEENLARVEAYYAEQEVPFDPGAGFDPERVIREAPDWAILHGVVPLQLSQLQLSTIRADAGPKRSALGRLSFIHATLGAYEKAIDYDRRLLHLDFENVDARRRIVWSLLRMGRHADAMAEAEILQQQPGFNDMARLIVEATRAVDEIDSSEDRAALIARLPLLTPFEASQLAAGVVSPSVRPQRTAVYFEERAGQMNAR
jgi:hypothetical protein